MKTAGNTVLITGGASGIGLAIARVFREKGNTVIVCGRNADKLDNVKRQYPDIHTISCDVANPGEVTRMVGEVASRFPSLNILVNNAGILHQYDFLGDEDALRKIDEEIDINFRAAARLAKLFLPNLVKAPEAAIVNVSSLLGVVPKKSAPVYCATKAALHAFSRSLRYQLQATPVKVFAIITPLVDTDMTRGRENDAVKMSPEALAREVFRGIETDRYEIEPGPTKFVLLLNRFVPSLIQKAMAKR
ncbi:MAG: SDR family oxidoreductase [Syntrophales bacterium]